MFEGVEGVQRGKPFERSVHCPDIGSRGCRPAQKFGAVVYPTCLPRAPDDVQGLSASAVFQRIPQTRWARPALGALGLLLAGTLLLSMVRVVRRLNSPKAKRRRTVDLNKVPRCFFSLLSLAGCRTAESIWLCKKMMLQRAQGGHSGV